MIKTVKNGLTILTMFLGIAMPCMSQSQQSPVKPKVQTSASPEQTAVYRLKGDRKDKQATASKVADERKGTPKNQASKAAKSLRKNRERSSGTSNGRYMALKSNIAYDALAILNLAFEMQVHDKMTVELPVMWSLWDMEQEHGIRTVALQPEARWWTGSEVGKGHFFGLHAHVAWFNVKWNKNRYQDTARPLLGAGLSYGYRLPLNEHWGAEFSLGVGYANMKYNTYYNIDNGAQLDTRIRHYWGVTRIEASLAYRF